MMRFTTNAVADFEREHQRILRQGSPESMVLLKNDGILPLQSVQKVALYGSGARETIKGGTGSGDVNVRHFVTVEEGLENAGLTITTKQWLSDYGKLKKQDTDDYYGKLQAQAEKDGLNPMLAMMGKMPLEPDYDLKLTSDQPADVAVYVLARNSGEGSDRHPGAGDLQLTTTEKRDILALAAQYQQFVLVLNVGGMVDIAPVADAVPAVLLLSQLGMETGSALADVLLGESYPSGKLTATWAPIDRYSSTANFGNMDSTEYKEGVYVGYRYFDSMNITPAYPFGFGLGYTNFKLAAQPVELNHDQVQLAVDVDNVGKLAGKEVVQVYVSKPHGTVDVPYQELVAYAKTPELAAGEHAQVKLQFALKDLAVYFTSKAQMMLPAGDYVIRVGNSSRNTHVVAKLHLDQATVTAQYQHVGGETHFTDFVPATQAYSYAAEATELEQAPVIEIDPAAIETVSVQYSKQDQPELPAGERVDWPTFTDGKHSLTDFVAGLSNAELARIAVGHYVDTQDADDPNVIGSAGTTVAGSAGETTHVLDSLGLPTLIMADGPAGLRLSPKYTETADGQVQSLTSSFAGMAGADATEATVKADQPTFYQYCTAIPIGTAIAQSWNVDLAQAYGDLVGEEMALFNVDIWLAPALNIQRSPLDGRDFEYYSEDPLVAGLNAAAITRGVQSHPGKATTIKHFVANNQETNRQASNSVINERPLREIYLKGFEIAVKTAQPHTIMSSYNLLNGVHVPNRFDIMTNVLRDEWGFKGFAMTDWFTTGGVDMSGGQAKYAPTSAAGEIVAGNDLTMPGTPADTKAILAACKAGRVSRGQLQANALRILKVVYALSQY
ncbi:glycoside hydrolase family 3 protein [Lactiplantibacillus modestisalitolerans]|uniref:Glycoside hydrolase family 3 C-terminal domain-containing protein n=1 Tax=Lactiplantibacillus modestisalitolerans TaxID=1457219 RepID=A0ABV5WS26_9LACO|nr:glycoside hydrolase family 3 protein [Lactiplantibacillus modestisalitolerans]